MLNDSDKDVEILNSLITTTIDSAHGFERSAEDVDAARFSSMFREFAGERREMVTLLQAQVRKLGGEPNDDGSLKADLHRRWVDLRNAIQTNGDKAVVEEVERGEDYIKAKYETAMKDDTLSAESCSVVTQAYDSVRRGHDRARDLKHNMQSASA